MSWKSIAFYRLLFEPSHHFLVFTDLVKYLKKNEFVIPSKKI